MRGAPQVVTKSSRSSKDTDSKYKLFVINSYLQNKNEIGFDFIDFVLLCVRKCHLPAAAVHVETIPTPVLLQFLLRFTPAAAIVKKLLDGTARSIVFWSAE